MRALLIVSSIVLVVGVAGGWLHSPAAAGGALVGVLLTAPPAFGIFAALRAGLSPTNAALAMTAGRLLLLVMACVLGVALLPAETRRPFFVGLLLPYLAMLVADSILLVRETKRLPPATSTSNANTDTNDSESAAE